LVLVLLNGCIVDIPSARPEGPSVIVYGKVLNNETNSPINGAVVSDGYSTTVSNGQGGFRLKSYPGASHVFISVPEEYEIPMKDGMPQIFKSIGDSKDSVKINFNLKPLKDGVENEFTLIAVGDPQVLNASNLKRLNSESIPDIKAEIKKYNNVYGITLGDLAFDSLRLLREVKQSFISTDIPFFHTIGNHDFASNIYDPASASEEFVSNFGPLDYSFNRGNAHIVVMNNVFNYGVTSYNWGFSEEQINWLKSDLKHVPKEKMLIVSVHVPVFPSTTMERKSQFLEAISPYNEVHILSGHWHANRNIINSDFNVYEHITGTASGMWWSSNVNKCGAPNGYGVYEISGNKMKNWYYKSVNYSREYQITMTAPHTFGDNDGYVVANIWNADENWKVEFFEDGVNMGQMERFTTYAPEVFALNKSKNIKEDSNWYFKTSHLFRVKPTKKDAVFTIQATDAFGNIYRQSTPIASIEMLKTYKVGP
jgi:hypothetical protein